MKWVQLRDAMFNAVGPVATWAARYETPAKRCLAPIFATTMFGVALLRSWPVDQMEGTYRDVFVLSDHIASHAFLASLLNTVNAACGIIIAGAAIVAMSVFRTGQNEESCNVQSRDT